MGQVSTKLRSREGGGFSYWCQGCEEVHAVDGTWTFDGNLEAPTFSPSVLTRSGHFLSNWKEGDPCWCTYNRDHPNRPSSFKCRRCHTFIRGGMVEFLDDCSHALVGQTLPLPDLPPHLLD